ncbi:hypothetical protein [Streptococcus sp. Marseille-P7375]|jgi:hypothetical protein|uniref:hypothetical protein n=1 Tax=Streptococcus sp. Marseille-P7375 TaxID=2487318 RepID=UPI000A54AA5A|nr:hypothetical protein [Streptococcus sp. Marseille-P7375]
MKIKIFYQQQKQSLQEFEAQINNFMASVEVVDVKCTEATEGDDENLSATLGLLVLYKE